MVIDRTEWDKTFAGYCKGEVEFNVPMAGHTSLAIGGPADVVVSPEDPVSMKNLVLLLGRQGMPFLPVGGGTNILVRDEGIEGVVIKCRAFGRVEILHDTGDTIELFAEPACCCRNWSIFAGRKDFPAWRVSPGFRVRWEERSAEMQARSGAKSRTCLPRR